MASIIWTDIAQSNLIQIREYIALSSVLQADMMVKSLYAKALVLERHPEAGKPLKELPHLTYRELLLKPYRIIYRVKEDSVYIVSVQHSARLLQNNPFFRPHF